MKCEFCDDNIFDTEGKSVDKPPAKIEYTDENESEDPVIHKEEICLDCYGKIYSTITRMKDSS